MTILLSVQGKSDLGTNGFFVLHVFLRVALICPGRTYYSSLQPCIRVGPIPQRLRKNGQLCEMNKLTMLPPVFCRVSKLCDLCTFLTNYKMPRPSLVPKIALLPYTLKDFPPFLWPLILLFLTSFFYHRNSFEDAPSSIHFFKLTRFSVSSGHTN